MPILKYRPSLNGTSECAFLTTAKAIGGPGEFRMAALGALESFRPSYPFQIGATIILGLEPIEEFLKVAWERMFYSCFHA